MKTQLVTPQQFFEAFVAEYEPRVKELLPSTMKQPRFLAATQIYLQKNPRLLQADRLSLFDALLKCARDGLMPDGREAAIVPFRDTDSKKVIAQYLPMVQGILKRLRQLTKAYSIECEAVYEADEFNVVLGDDPKIHHKPKVSGPRGKVMAAYCIIKDARGVVLSRSVLPREEIEKIRNVSRAKTSSAWTQWYDQMAIKTAIRRAAKNVPTLDEDFIRLVNADDEYVLLEGHATDITPSRSEMSDISLDDIDEDGNIRVIAGPPPEPSQADAAPSDSEPEPEPEPEPCSEPEPDPDEDPFASSADVVAELREELAQCETKDEAMQVAARFKPRLRTKEERERASIAWKATSRRIARAAQLREHEKAEA